MLPLSRLGNVLHTFVIIFPLQCMLSLAIQTPFPVVPPDSELDNSVPWRVLSRLLSALASFGELPFFFGIQGKSSWSILVPRSFSHLVDDFSSCATTVKPRAASLLNLSIPITVVT